MANNKEYMNVNEVIKVMDNKVSKTELIYAYNGGICSGYNVTGKIEDTMLDVDDVLDFMLSGKVAK